jgi:hypothetical protein
MRKITIAVVALLVGGLLLVAGAAQAKQGFYLGLGAASMNVSGDLADPTTWGCNSNCTSGALFGQFPGGTGSSLNIGYGFNDNIALEIYSVSSKANSTYSGGVQFAFPTTVTASMIDLRFSAKIGKESEVFARLGPSAGLSAAYTRNAVVNNTVTDSTLSGSGPGYAAGAEIMFGKVGVGFSVAQFTATFDTIEIGGTKYAYKALGSNTVSTSDVMLSYHF